jgi:hypothetical protein
LDPDPDPDPYWSPASTSGSGSGSVKNEYGSETLLSLCKNNKKNLESYCFVSLFDFSSLKNNVNVPSKSNKQKKLCEKISFLLES